MFHRSLLPLGALLLWCASVEGSWLDRWLPRGVVVGKVFRPSVVGGSLGTEGIYKLQLRGEDKKIRPQMVSYEIFCAYEVGDRFDPATPLPAVHALRQEIAIEEKRASLALSVTDSPAPPAMGPPERTFNPRFTQDMLPETEAF